MQVSRRSFLSALGMGGVATVVAPGLTARGREGLVGRWPDQLLSRGLPSEVLRLHSNENPVGPGPEAVAAIQGSTRDAARYPGSEDDLAQALARELGVKPNQLLLGAGSTETLHLAVAAFTSSQRGLVTGAPSFETPAVVAEARGVPVWAIPVDRRLALDLDAMAAQTRHAGLVYLCNPNNPTSTIHSAADVQVFITTVLRNAPDAVVLVDEAYHHYVGTPEYQSAIPLALENPRVIVARTFSKAYGLAGLRVGAAIGRPETLARMAVGGWNMAISVPGLAAAAAVVGDRERLDQERTRNREARAFTIRAFESAGYTVARSDANFIMVDLRQPMETFRAACRDRDILVGRPFPPLNSHVRISIGTMAEMQRAVDVFREVLPA